ncbi:ABC transporter substrate-binding protein [Aestuariibaculum sediminum]|uniref:ABC transporter substrate-binding protein n=1 Tax=Aestuariibaculum sediminum TaxID=2770637 RepID=A0A8J6QAT8_9FLAO|nr:ABC transporter substrate-binding protein [Aestuariibaculum sediminum]MBD0832281.1 ABC transporter substrate-binding protein [Aestuariibaculum sediminum]
MFYVKNFIALILLIVFCACKSEPKKKLWETLTGKPLNLKYATGFSAKDYGNFTILSIKNPWPNNDKAYHYALLKKGHDPEFWTLEKSRFDGIIELPIKKIVVTSTTHLPALELLRVENTLVGFPGTDFISSTKIRRLVDRNQIKDLGKNEGINTEILLETQPDVVVGFGIDGKNKALETVKKSGIPVIFNGDWVEHSPLAKAEWVKFFGVLFQKQRLADSIFKNIEKNYLEAKKLAKNAKTKPSILSGAMHKDIWYLPNGSSTEAQLLTDANTNYLWKNTLGSGSLSLNFETVFSKAQHADIWLSPSNYTSFENLKNGNPHHATFDAFKNKNIYSFTNTTGKTGGVTYFELGLTRPDLVLKDLIKICHPELLKNYDLYFFKPLE